MSQLNQDTQDPRQHGPIPRHVAIIMDGNGRWARRRRLPRTAGHRAGAEAVRRVLKSSISNGIDVLTLFAFSSENWRRPESEVGLLMELFLQTLEREVEILDRHDVRVVFIGDRDAFSAKLRDQIVAAEEATCGNSRITLVIAASYGGRWDITEGARKVAEQVKSGELDIAQITPELFASYLSLAGLPEPDLFIRTGGEQRISNFLLWHLAYTELCFSDVLWPDFDEGAFERALAWYAGRERRFGRIAEQLAQSDDA
jgi:undecaprenyl diphosphate synthase